MSMSSRKKKDSQAKKAAWRTLLFVNIVAPIVLLVLDKSLPDGLLGRKENTRAHEISAGLRRVCQPVRGQKKIPAARMPQSLSKQGQTEPKAAPPGVRFFNKGSGNVIENTQEIEGGAKSAGFSNEGNHNSIKNVQRSK